MDKKDLSELDIAMSASIPARIGSSHAQLATTVNSTLTVTYWHVRQRIRVENFISAVSRHLSWAHLRRLIYIENPFKRDCEGVVQ